MSNLPHIQRKIKSVSVTSRITHALEIISTTQHHSYRELQSNSLPYLQGIYKIFFELFGDPEHDIRETNKRFISFQGDKKELWVVLGTDIGMCGDMNERIKKYIVNEFDKNSDGLVVLGRRLKDHLEPFLGRHMILQDKSELKVNEAAKSIRQLCQKLFNLFMNENYQKLTLVYIKDPKAGTLDKINILPFKETYFEHKSKVYVRPWSAKVKYPDVIIDLFPQYLECVVLSAVIGSKLGEHGIRRELMHSATKNANELLSEYKLLFNKIRQANITQEITEIVVASKFKDKK